MPSRAKQPKRYKIIGIDGSPLHGGSGLWHLPKNGKPARWMPKVDDVCACASGYHLITALGIVEWLPLAPITGYLCEAEGRGDESADGNKTAFAQARLIKVVGLLDEKSMRLAAAEMAERALPIFYKVRPNDDRPAKAIQAARDYANGKIGDAATDAARAAARAAAGAAAWAAARAAAWAAARAAATDAAGDAAWDANAKIIIKHAAARLRESSISSRREGV